MTADRRASVPDPLARFILRLSQPNTPVLPDIVRFAEDPEFLALPQPLYPRQKTFLRLVTLDVEHMTDYDHAVIDEWSRSFYAGEDRVGVVPDAMPRAAWLLERG